MATCSSSEVTERFQSDLIIVPSVWKNHQSHLQYNVSYCFFFFFTNYIKLYSVCNLNISKWTRCWIMTWLNYVVWLSHQVLASGFTNECLFWFLIRKKKKKKRKIRYYSWSVPQTGKMKMMSHLLTLTLLQTSMILFLRNVSIVLVNDNESQQSQKRQKIQDISQNRNWWENFHSGLFKWKSTLHCGIENLAKYVLGIF